MILFSSHLGTSLCLLVTYYFMLWQSAFAFPARDLISVMHSDSCCPLLNITCLSVDLDLFLSARVIRGFSTCTKWLKAFWCTLGLWWSILTFWPKICYQVCLTRKTCFILNFQHFIPYPLPPGLFFPFSPAFDHLYWIVVRLICVVPSQVQHYKIYNWTTLYSTAVSIFIFNPIYV